MVTLRIISNPYKKEIRFKKKSDDGTWVDINYENNPNSKLLRKDIAEGFFPFKAKQIVDFIIEEYSVSGESFLLVFEGTMDEYLELEAVCAEEPESVQINTERSDIELANARDILPEVKKLFQKMSPLIMQSVNKEDIQYDLSRFEDASSDVVPICVLGNYSSGKSTFINALIGSEILPSGAEPVTAKVYKIARSKYSDRAYIAYKYYDKNMRLTFTEHETFMDCESVDTTLPDQLNTALEEVKNESIAVRVNHALTIINDYEDSIEGLQISDLIEVEVPFANGVLAKSQHPFVIFDTPGSNSASNERHLLVLKDAMANMTNGLPIFLSTPDSLDSTDNENLYQIIRSFEELDDRFTMIVVNKADSAGVQRRSDTEQEQNRILRQAVPRNLYSGGIFYVSSILGLGAKTGGEFEDYFYEDIYDAQEKRYRDPDDKHYRTLYLFNIMPPQIKHRSDELSAKQTDLIYANSGLFSVETEIETFAGKYSAYNKCFQSQLFLGRVIQITEKEIQAQKQKREEIRQTIKDKLDADKQRLMENLEQNASAERDRYDSGYSDYMSEYLQMTEGTFSPKDLKKQYEVFTTEQEKSKDYDKQKQEVRDAREAVASSFKTNVSQVWKDRRPDLSALADTARDLTSGFGTIMDRSKKQREVRKEVDLAAADDLLRYVANVYEEKLAEFHVLIDRKSREYWTENTEKIRTLLARVVSGSEVLTEERRKELEHIIITYEQISFRENTGEEIFKKANFERRLRLGIVNIKLSDDLDTPKLARTYNDNMRENITRRYKSIDESHKESAHNWIRDLLDEINTNIVKYSPELSKQAKQIQELSKEIEDLRDRQIELERYTEELGDMMDWRGI